GSAPCEARERFGRSVVEPAAAQREPLRQREVIEGHQELESERARRTKQLAVASERPIVEAARLRLEPTPLETQAVGVLSERTRRSEVFLGAARPPFEGPPRARSVADLAGTRLPLEPIIGVVVTLDLMRRGRRSPQESGRKGSRLGHRVTRLVTAFLNG